MQVFLKVLDVSHTLTTKRLIQRHNHTPTPQDISYPERANKTGIEKNGGGEHSGPSEQSNRLGIKYGYS